MKFSIKTTNLELTTNISNHLEKTINSLDKLVKNIDLAVWAQVEIGRTSQHHKSGRIYRAEVQIHLPEKLIRSEVTAVTIFQAINEARDELQRELKQYKGRKTTEQKKGIRKIKKVIKQKIYG